MAELGADISQCRQFIEELPAAVILINREGVIQLANPAAALLLGSAAEELSGQAASFLLYPGSHESLLYILTAVIDRGSTRKDELFLRRQDGVPRHVSIDFSHLRYGGQPVACAVLRDETELRTSQWRFQRSQAFAGIGTWDWNIETGHLFWSETTPSLFGYHPDELEASCENFLSLVHPDDRDRVREGVRNCLDNNSKYHVEHRVVWPDGTIRWVLGHGDVTRDEAGRPLHMLGVVQDISARKEAQADQELAAAVIRNTPEGVVVTDARMRILSVNPAFASTTGYREDEVLGRTPALLSSGRHDKAFYKTMWEALEETGQWQGEIWNRRKNGDIYPEWLNISAIRDSEGEVLHYAGIFSDLSTQEHVRKRLHNLAYYDGLTQLPNRELFRDRLLNAMARCRRSGGSVGLIFLDIDRFKTINDSLGHSAGDQLLKEVGRRLQMVVRETDTVARLGGDEFAIIVTDISQPENAAPIASQLLEALAKPLVIEGHELVTTSSLGISIYPSDGHEPEVLTRNADAAMYRAKELGRNNYQFYTEGMSARSAERLVLESELRKSIERGELSLAFQPQVELASGTMSGVEVLARWHNRQLGQVRPDIFIEVAEDIGFIDELGRWVLREALRQLQCWREQGFTSLCMAVNVSGYQLANSDLVDEVAGLLDGYDVPPECLELELTESVLMENAEATMAVLASLHGLGVTLAVDDFGTGYSSLAYLKRFDLDKLKIDKSFVREIPDDINDTEIAATVIAMGQNLGLKVVAEGVETIEQLRFMARQGCDQIQGYYFSPPVTAEELSGLLERKAGIKMDELLATEPNLA